MIVDPIYDNARLYRIRKETEDIKMEKKDIDWSNLSFGYQETDYSYVSNYKDGKWDDGQLTKDHTVTLNECAGVFQYAQTCSICLYYFLNCLYKYILREYWHLKSLT